MQFTRYSTRKPANELAPGGNLNIHDILESTLNSRERKGLGSIKDN